MRRVATGSSVYSWANTAPIYFLTSEMCSNHQHIPTNFIFVPIRLRTAREKKDLGSWKIVKLKNYQQYGNENILVFTRFTRPRCLRRCLWIRHLMPVDNAMWIWSMESVWMCTGHRVRHSRNMLPWSYGTTRWNLQRKLSNKKYIYY